MPWSLMGPAMVSVQVRPVPFLRMSRSAWSLTFSTSSPFITVPRVGTFPIYPSDGVTRSTASWTFLPFALTWPQVQSVAGTSLFKASETWYMLKRILLQSFPSLSIHFSQSAQLFELCPFWETLRLYIVEDSLISSAGVLSMIPFGVKSHVKVPFAVVFPGGIGPPVGLSTQYG